MMTLAAEIAVSALLITGGVFALIGSWGLVRLPSLMTRLHGPTKASTVGVGACLIASMLYFPVFAGTWTAHELLIAIFLFMTAPITAHMIAKVHIHRQGAGIDSNPGDDHPDLIPDTGLNKGWATLDDGEGASIRIPPEPR